VKAHGGFRISNKANLAYGVDAHTNINGVLPLFLFKEHWAIAKRRCP
jgi:hypothetical protein